MAATYNQYAAGKNRERSAMDVEELLSAMPAVLLKVSQSGNKLNRKTPAKLRLPNPSLVGEKNVRLQQIIPHAGCPLGIPT